MNNRPTVSTGQGGTRDSNNNSNTTERNANCGDHCDIDIRIDCRGDVNIYNCSTPSQPGTGPLPPSSPPCQPCFPPLGACLPIVPGAKHKQSRDHKLAKRAERARVPSALAAGTLHMVRRFLLGKSPVGVLEVAAFATLGRMSRDLLSCTVSAFDTVPPGQRDRLFAPSLLLNADQPIDTATLTAALAQEIKQRVALDVFDDLRAVDEARPGRVRVITGEHFEYVVRICTINGLRTANFVPRIGIGEYLPTEIQHDCEIMPVNGQPESVCHVRTTDCPGNLLQNPNNPSQTACARVLEVAQGDSLVLQGVNYFSLDAKVRIGDPQTGTIVREVETHVWGDVETPVTEEIGGQPAIIRDCRVHDRLTFRVPADLPPRVYLIQVVVPNTTGRSGSLREFVSNGEFINVVPPSTARYEIVAEKIIARKETSPEWPGSDEVGLQTVAIPIFADGSDAGPQVTPFHDVQQVKFDSATPLEITRNVFRHDRPIAGVMMTVLGYEIDSRRAYREQITSSMDFFIDLVKEQAKLIKQVLDFLNLGLGDLKKFGSTGAWLAAIGAAVTLAIDAVVALWAPADLIIQDTFGLSVLDLERLTNADFPAPDRTTFTTPGGIVVNVNKLMPPRKLPTEYWETREYISEEEGSRYVITYRFNRVA